MGLSEKFRTAIEHYPPEYKAIKTQMVADFLTTHEGVWNALHLELLALELFALATKSKPKKIAEALVQALEESHERWGHVHQQLLNSTDEMEAKAVREACLEGGVFQPVSLPPDRVGLEKLANALLGRMTSIGQELTSQTPAQVATKAISRAVTCLGPKHATNAITCAGYVDLRDRITPLLENAEPFPQSSGKAKKSLLLVAVLLALLVGAVGLYLSRDGSSAAERFQAAKAHYAAQEFEAAVERAESAVSAFKNEGASPKQIHEVRKFLSSAYYKDGDLEAAVAQMEILCKAYPDNADYKKTLAQLKSEL